MPDECLIHSEQSEESHLETFFLTIISLVTGLYVTLGYFDFLSFLIFSSVS